LAQLREFNSGNSNHGSGANNMVNMMMNDHNIKDKIQKLFEQQKQEEERRRKQEEYQLKVKRDEEEKRRQLVEEQMSREQELKRQQQEEERVREVIFSYLDSYTGKKSLKFIPPI
jgi:spore germination cell wall hydrolase CwlJ-like protein